MGLLTSPHPKTTTLAISGMTCAACAARLEKALNRTPGVLQSEVNFVLEEARVSFDPAVTGPTDLSAAVADAGFTGRLAGTPAPDPKIAAARDGWAALAAAILTLPLVAQMVGHGLGFHLHLSPWLEFGLTVPIQFGLGARFYRGAWAALRQGGANMDVLVALGTSSAFGYSLALVLTDGSAASGRLYFEAAAVVVTMVLFGKWLEARAKRATAGAVKALMALRPTTATVLRHGLETEIPIGDVRPDDLLLVRPGGRVPVDGEITAGTSELDESSITGESVAVARTVGGHVTAGSLNGSGLLTIRVIAAGNDTTLAAIIRLVESAQSGKAPLQRLVDKVSAIFAPVVLVLALVTFVAWMVSGVPLAQAIGAAVAVLVIACPCALGLAMPTAIVAGLGAAARHGILFKDITALEHAPRIDTIVFDKTGTLTQGLPRVDTLRVLHGTEAHLLNLAAAVQHGSEHLLARATITAAQQRGLDIPVATNFESMPGLGIRAVVAGSQIAVGNAAMMAQVGITAVPPADQTVAYVASDKTLLGFVTFTDPLRPESAASVKALLHRGLRVIMLSGDSPAVVARISAVLGLHDAQGALKPADKAAAVSDLRAAGRRVAMVGDGVNDAPALAVADLGIALGTGTDVAVETAAVTLMRPDPRLVAAALDIAARTSRIIRENLFWAFAYNVIALPLAASGALNPMVAGAAMAASSVSVVLNALRLTRWRPDLKET